MPQFQTDDGVAIVYDDCGARDGMPIVFVHGLSSSSEQHAADAEYFAGRGYRVLVPDLRGHGRSGKPTPMVAASFSASRMAQDVLLMLKLAEAGPVHWVGNSLGGILGLELMAREPARFRSFATFATTYSLNLPRVLPSAIPWVHAVLGRERYAKIVARLMSREPATLRIITRVIERWDPQVGFLVGRNLCRYDLIANAVAATMPILMLRAGRDPQVNSLLGPTLHAMHARSNFRLVEVPNAGHCANLDATDHVRNELESFWSTG